MTPRATAAQIRSRLGHPIVDADGHWIEHGPALRERFQRIGGVSAVDGLAAAQAHPRAALSMSVAERNRVRMPQENFWGLPTHTEDRAMAMMPRLFYQRLDEIGIDFAILYPSEGLSLPRIEDDALRRAACRAYNVVVAEEFAAFADRLTPAAIIPMNEPGEAIAEIEYVTQTLGLKAAMFGSLIRRSLPTTSTFLNGTQIVEWYDVLGIDSAFDYDPVWQACLDRGISPTFHSPARRHGFRNSPSNFTYNHIGHFAAAGEAVCKALFLGGVTRRFPDLRFGFLEGGVAWATTLYADLISHWRKRGREGLKHTDPRLLDSALLRKLAEEFAAGELLEVIRKSEGRIAGAHAETTGGLADLDDFSACGIERAEEIAQLFVERFAFGCEADDPANAWAFNRRANPFGTRLNAMLSSDIGHWDVPDVREIVPEAYELVEDGLMSADDFRLFSFENAVRFFGATNPRFFTGTVVERAAANVLERAKTRRSIA